MEITLNITANVCIDAIHRNIYISHQNTKKRIYFEIMKLGTPVPNCIDV